MPFALVIVDNERTHGLPTGLLNKINTKESGPGISHLAPCVWSIDTSKALKFLAEIVCEIQPPVKCRVLFFDKDPEESSWLAT